MMNISPMVNSVKCTVFSRFVQFWHVLVLEAWRAYLKILLALLKSYLYANANYFNYNKMTRSIKYL